MADVPSSGRPIGNASLHGLGTVGEMVLHALNRHEERTAFVIGTRHVSYAETRRAIAAAKAAFRALGLRRGDTVVQLTKNRPEQWFVVMALVMSGLRSVALHALGSIDDHIHIINDSEANLVLLDGAFVDRSERYREACKGVTQWLSHDDGTVLPGFWTAAGELPAERLRCDSAPGDIVRLAYTGGTTGRPKGVMLSARSLMTTALLSLAEWELPTEIRMLCAAPLSHGAGSLIIPTLCRGGTLYLQQGFSTGDFMDAIAAHRITAFYGVPSMLYSLLDDPRAPGFDWSSVDFILYGGSPMSPARIEEAIRVFGPVLNQAYGQTEAPSCITLLRKADHQAANDSRLLSCGMSYAGISVAILDDACQPVAAGVAGELCVRGPHVMDGYWKNPEETAKAFEGGWLHTGDIAYSDEDGYIHLVDRKKDMIITGGFNVYPKEVEDAVMNHPAVAAVAVIGVPDPKWGEAVKAFVVCRPQKTVQERELLAFVREAKGPVNTPKSVAFLEALPMTALGKPDKKALRSAFWTDAARSIA
jgi:fatty-acyl-CoA synthase